MAATDLAFTKGLPANLDAERFVLGSVLLNDSIYMQVAGSVDPDDFSLEKHRRIFARMKDLYERGEKCVQSTPFLAYRELVEEKRCDQIRQAQKAIRRSYRCSPT